MKTFDIRGYASSRPESTEELLIARLTYDDKSLTVILGAGSEAESQHTVDMWEHGVYELQQLACAVEVVSQWPVKKVVKAKPRDELLGPNSQLSVAIHIEVGHPGINKPHEAVKFYLFPMRSRVVKNMRPLGIEVAGLGLSYKGFLSLEEATSLAKQLYDAALELAPTHIINWDGTDTG